MYGELGSVKGIVDLSPQEALDSAEALLRGLNYRIVRRSDTSITASRSRFEGAENVATLTVAISPQLEGGVRITLRGNDHEGMRENQPQWRTWSEGLPKKPGTEIVESPNVPLPAPHQPNAPVLSGPQQVPTVAPPPREGSTVWRGTKLAFGGCVILPVLLLIGFVGCFALIGGGSEEEAEPKGPGQSRKNPVAIGNPLTVGDATWTIQNATQATELSARFSRTAQGNFVIVNFSFTNNSDEAVSVDETYLTLIDEQDRRSEPDPDKFEYIPDSRYLFYENVNPGVTREGQAIFTVAPDATDFTLEAASTEAFSDEKGFVDPGF